MLMASLSVYIHIYTYIKYACMSYYILSADREVAGG